MDTQHLPQNREDLIAFIARGLDNEFYCDFDDGNMIYLFDSSDADHKHSRSYEVVFSPYECGADQEVSIIMDRNEVLYEGGMISGSSKKQAFEIVATHMAEEIISLRQLLSSREGFAACLTANA